MNIKRPVENINRGGIIGVLSQLDIRVCPKYKMVFMVHRCHGDRIEYLKSSDYMDAYEWEKAIKGQ